MDTEQSIQYAKQKLIVKLQDIYSRKLLIPVVGSGLSIPFQMPDWKALIRAAAEHFELREEEKEEMEKFLREYKFLEAIDVIVNNGTEENALQQFIAGYIAEIKGTVLQGTENNYEDLAHMKQIRFMTTNYDEYLNEIAGAESFPLQKLSEIPVNEFALSEYDGRVIPLHGEISHPETIIFSRKSYENLYRAEQFEREFQHLRTHFTFLFMGFSFDDVYFQQMFEKIVNRFEATHYILLSDCVRKEHPEKVARLRNGYGVEVISYDTSEGHVKPISHLLNQICRLSDLDIDSSTLEKLPESSKGLLSSAEQEIIDRGREAIAEERLTEVQHIYFEAYESEQFREHSIEFQVEVVCGLLWYNGYIGRNDLNEELYERELAVPEMNRAKSKFTFMYAQSLWNLRQYEKCLELLKDYAGEEKVFLSFFRDVVRCFQRFLPESSVVSGNLPVYGETARTKEEQAEYREAYFALKKKYINAETYNLLNLRQYRDMEQQQIVYYYMGVAAGQLFHEHREAIQYLNRAYELIPTMSVCEELAHNYLELGHDAVRYRRDGKTHELNTDSLLKAKIHFQYLMNFDDSKTKHDFYRKSGHAYLKTLFWLRNYQEFEAFYEEASADIPSDYDLYLMKAQADIYYYGQLSSEKIIEKLNEEDKRFIEFLQLSTVANIVFGENKIQGGQIRKEILKEILKKADQIGHPISDMRVVNLLLDAVVFTGDIPYYEKMKSIYPAEIFQEVIELGFESELYGRLQEAQEKFEYAFQTYHDYQGTFHILRSFYIRHGDRNAYHKLYESVIAEPPEPLFQTAEFFAEYVVAEIRDWSDTWSAILLYSRYYDRIQENSLYKKELEETLKVYVADYRDYENRIAWNRYVLTKAPERAKPDIYLSILKLYVANCEFRRAEDVLEEMKRLKIPVKGNFANLIHVCIRKQRNSAYVHQKPYLSSNKAELMKIQSEMRYHGRFHRQYFGAYGQEIILSVKQCMCIFYENRQKELEGFSRIYIMYAGVINLQNSLWAREDVFLRMVLQWIASAPNVMLEAPSFLRICEEVPKRKDRDYIAETVQRKLFAEEHPEALLI